MSAQPNRSHQSATSEPPEFRFEVATTETSAIVRLHGELDIATAPTASEILATALAEGTKQLILDLRRLEFIDSSGLNLIFRFNRVAREQDRSFTIIRGGPQIQRAFELTGLDRRLSIVEMVGEPENGEAETSNGARHGR